MGWASASDIFDPVAKVTIEATNAGDMREGVAVYILGTLAKKLSDGDWDTWDESLQEFDNHPVVVRAFREAGLEAECWGSDGEEGHRDCSLLATCKT